MIQGSASSICAVPVPGAPAWARLWHVDLDALGAVPSALTDPERLRAQRFAFDRDRRRFLAARLALRTLLADEAGLDPRVEFAEGPEGKPCLRDPVGVRFNLSHSGRHALIGMSKSDEIGVDVEVLRPVNDLKAVAALHFTDRERSAWQATNPGMPVVERFLQGWTRKEACLKALGVGLTVDTRRFETELTDGEVAVQVPVGAVARRVWIVNLDAGPGLLAAVARVDSDDVALRADRCGTAPSDSTDPTIWAAEP